MSDYVTQMPAPVSRVVRYVLAEITMPDGSGVGKDDPEAFTEEFIRVISNAFSGVSVIAEQVHPEYDEDNSDNFVESNLGNFNINGFGTDATLAALAERLNILERRLDLVLEDDPTVAAGEVSIEMTRKERLR